MAVFKFVIGDDKKSYQIEKEQKDCPVIGKKIGNTISADFLGLSGYELKITGGSDKDGFPMRKDIDGTVRKKFIITKGVGLDTNIRGLRRRKTLRGNTIGLDIVQINCKVIKKGENPLEEILGKKEEIKEAEEKIEEVKKEKKEEAEEVKEGRKEVKKEEKIEKPKEEKKPEETVEKKAEEKKEEQKEEPKKEKDVPTAVEEVE